MSGILGRPRYHEHGTALEGMKVFKCELDCCQTSSQQKGATIKIRASQTFQKKRIWAFLSFLSLLKFILKPEIFPFAYA